MKASQLQMALGFLAVSLAVLLQQVAVFELFQNQYLANTFKAISSASLNSFPQFALAHGLALGFVMAWGPRLLPSLYAGTLISLLISTPALDTNKLLFCAFSALVLILHSGAVYALCRQFCADDKPLSNHRSFVFFAFACMVSALFSSTLLQSNQSLFLTQEVLSPAQSLSQTLSITAASLLLAPVFISLLEWRKPEDDQELLPWHPKQNQARRQHSEWLELSIWLIITLVLTSYFAGTSHYSVILAAPLLIWPAVRFQARACSAAVCLATLAILAAMSVAGDDHSHHSVDVWLEHHQDYLSWLLMALASLYLNTLLADKKRSEQKLEQIVAQRTLDLSLANQELKDEVFVREQAERSQRSSSKRYRTLIETAGIPIIVLEHNCSIRKWNRAAELDFGYKRDEVLGKNFVDIFIPPEQQDEMRYKLTRVINNGIKQDTIETEALSANGQSHTMLWTINQLPEPNEHSTERQYLLVGQNISDIRKTQDQLHYLAHFDSLTGCANRRLFEDRCAQAIQSAIRHKHHIALIGLDIDHFKRINDTLGHDIGDAFLVELSKRLRQCVRKEDTIARLGGDEFAVLLMNVNGQEGAEVVARNMLETITQPINLKGNELIITSSIGITLCPSDGSHYPDLLKNADMAMYRAKNAGRNNIQFYSPEMNEEMQRQLHIEQELRIALKEQQFELFYQPIIDLDTGAVVALEALLRWQHPHKGMLRPDYFLQVAEQTGLLHEIGEWSLRTACQECHHIQASGAGAVQIAINLSSRQYNHPNLVPMFEQVLAEMAVDPGMLILEISEGTLKFNDERSKQVLNQLSDLGLSLSIDSFGTGLSSLRQIKQNPIDIIKIDRSFVSGIPEDQNDMIIAETLLTVAQQMERKTFATGVETPEQAQFLKQNGCRYAQGYLYSAPLPASGIRQLLNASGTGEQRFSGKQIKLQLANREHSALSTLK